MRKAYDRVRQLYIDQPLIQDLIETALMSAGSAGYQALFTDMDASDIATSTLIGAGLGLAARPVGAQLGKMGGRMIDEKTNGALKAYDVLFPITRDGSAFALKNLREKGSNNEYVRSIRDLLAAKRNMANATKNGAGTAEAVLGLALRNRADNIAQGGYALLSPYFTGEEDE